MKFVDVIWFNGRTSIGVVLVYSKHDGYKSYIDSCTVGFDESQDIKSIMDHGSKFPLEASKQLFPHIDFGLEPKFSK